MYSFGLPSVLLLPVSHIVILLLVYSVCIASTVNDCIYCSWI